nr:DM13 domain-containing protein [Micromonospora sp. DSM 115978]
LDVEPGPDYFVELVPGADRRSPDGGVRLDALKGNLGNQNYPVSADVQVTTPTTVLIWCRAFAVPIGNATIGG